MLTCRCDRIMVQSAGWEAVSAKLLGTKPLLPPSEVKQSKSLWAADGGGLASSQPSSGRRHPRRRLRYLIYSAMLLPKKRSSRTMSSRTMSRR